MLTEILDRLTSMPEQQQREMVAEAYEATKGMKFIPLPGPQTEAYFSEADVLLFGGSPGGGKTALEIGLALNEHRRALVARKEFVDLAGPLHTLDNILGVPRSASQGNRPVYRDERCTIDFIGLGDDLGGKQGNPHDLICIDEAAQIPEVQFRMLLGWMRTNIPGQRCRAVLGSNPPLDSVGDWLIVYFAPWLDPKHPNPAQPGELRFFLPTEDGSGDRECSKDDFIILHGVKVSPQSRTFIPSKFTDNPYYNSEEYAKALSGLPVEVRDRLTSGNFMLDRLDDEFQAIPTAWVRAAQARWTNNPPLNVPMCAIGVDVAQGGSDRTVLAPRYDGWYAPLISIPGKETPDGQSVAGLVVKHRRNEAKPIIDIGGGWGGDAYAALRENGLDARSYMGVKKSVGRTQDQLIKFTNIRSEAYWKFREALDPSQEQGSSIALPPDPELVADLCAPSYSIGSNGIQIEPKEKVCGRLGRSTDKGDAVVMAWWDGLKGYNIQGGWKAKSNRVPQVVTRRK